MMNDFIYFEKFDDRAEALYDDEKYAEAIAALEPAWEEFPERYFYIAWRMLICYRELGQFDEALRLVKRCGERGLFFSLAYKGWDPIRKVEGAEPVMTENERLKAEAKKDAKMHYDVHLPEGQMPEKGYPVFFALHCDSGFFGNIEIHQRHWKPDAMLRRGFLVVYVQSSQLISSTGAQWEEDFAQSRKDLLACYDAVAAEYAVDAEKVIVSGFSGGASASIDVCVNDVFPVKGFIALGPDKPEGFSKKKCELARQRGSKGVILEGEEMRDNPDLLEMETMFKATEFPYTFILNEGIGHWFPEDLQAKVDRAISFILNA